MGVTRPLQLAASISLATILTATARAQNQQQQAGNQQQVSNQNNAGNQSNNANNTGNQSTDNEMPPDNFGDGNLGGGNNFQGSNNSGANNFGNTSGQGSPNSQSNTGNGFNNAASQQTNNVPPSTNNFGNSAQSNNIGNSNAAPINGSGTNTAPVNGAPLNGAPANLAPANAAPINPATPNAAPTNASPSANAAPSNTAPTNAASTASSPITAPPPAPTGPAELKFNFDQNGLPAPHSFVLKWDNSAANLTSIIVKLSDNQKVIQTIVVPQDGSINLIYNELTPKPGRITDTIFSYIDFNFDKFGDIRLTKRWPYKVGEKSYAVWVFNPEANQYALHKAISDLPNAFPDQKARRIESISLGGWGGGEYEKRWYSLTTKGNLKLQTVAKQTIRDRYRLVFNREVRQRINGELQRICKLVVPTEGKIQRLWGTPERCTYHMEKQVIP